MVSGKNYMKDEKNQYWVWLSCLYCLGLKKIHQLLTRFGAPEFLWNAEASDIRFSIDISDDDILKLKDPATKEDAARKFEWISRNKINIINFHDYDYPPGLKTIKQPPVVLFLKGISGSMSFSESGHRSLAIVGSRKPTSYGVQVGYALSYQLSRNGLAIISGMAKGVDTYAHLGALKAGGITIAVLGCGIDIPYPKENKALMDRITASGAVITEYSPGTPPLTYNFPARNRIISGLSENIFIVEAGKKSGALITADYALEQGKDVFALPGSITSLQSVGTNRLIKDGAKIVTCAADILEEYNIEEKSQIADSPELLKYLYSPGGELDPRELKILEYLSQGTRSIDKIAEELGFTVSRAGSMMVMLELKGIVEQLPGYYYRLNNSPSEFI